MNAATNMITAIRRYVATAPQPLSRDETHALLRALAQDPDDAF